MVQSALTPPSTSKDNPRYFRKGGRRRETRTCVPMHARSPARFTYVEVETSIYPPFANLPYLVDHRGNVLLTTEAGVHSHDKDYPRAMHDVDQDNKRVVNSTKRVRSGRQRRVGPSTRTKDGAPGTSTSTHRSETHRGPPNRAHSPPSLLRRAPVPRPSTRTAAGVLVTACR